MSEFDAAAHGLHVRMLTEHGPRNERPRVCAPESAIAGSKGELVHAFGTTWRWSPIQRCWVEESRR